MTNPVAAARGWTTTWETVVSPRKGSRRIHWVQGRIDEDGVGFEDDVVALTPAICGQEAPAAGWLVVPEGLDHPVYGITHISCDRCFDRLRGPQH